MPRDHTHRELSTTTSHPDLLNEHGVSLADHDGITGIFAGETTDPASPCTATEKRASQIIRQLSVRNEALSQAKMELKQSRQVRARVTVASGEDPYITDHSLDMLHQVATLLHRLVKTQCCVTHVDIAMGRLNLYEHVAFEIIRQLSVWNEALSQGQDGTQAKPTATLLHRLVKTQCCVTHVDIAMGRLNLYEHVAFEIIRQLSVWNEALSQAKMELRQSRQVRARVTVASGEDPYITDHSLDMLHQVATLLHRLVKTQCCVTHVDIAMGRLNLYEHVAFQISRQLSVWNDSISQAKMELRQSRQVRARVTVASGEDPYITDHSLDTLHQVATLLHRLVKTQCCVTHVDIAMGRLNLYEHVAFEIIRQLSVWNEALSQAKMELRQSRQVRARVTVASGEDPYITDHSLDMLHQVATLLHRLVKAQCCVTHVDIAMGRLNLYEHVPLCDVLHGNEFVDTLKLRRS
ncbi:hypothetical protein MTO96_038591 [Rhipicephalus appendiculatus]